MFSDSSCSRASLAWKNLDAGSLAGLEPRAVSIGRTIGAVCVLPPPAIMLYGLLDTVPGLRAAVLNVGCETAPPAPLNLTSTLSPFAATNFEFEAVVGVLALPASGVDWALSARDLREDDRGVTFVAMNALTGVASSSLPGGGDFAPLSSLRTERRDPGVVDVVTAPAPAPPCCAARRGVRGDLTARFEASVGISGLPLALLLFVALDAFDRGESNGIVACCAVGLATRRRAHPVFVSHAAMLRPRIGTSSCGVDMVVDCVGGCCGADVGVDGSGASVM